jgi:hypothetical protein
MMGHKFKIGESVTIIAKRYDGRYGGSLKGRFRITRLLPPEDGNNQYRVQSLEDSHERNVFESDLA